MLGGVIRQRASEGERQVGHRGLDEGGESSVGLAVEGEGEYGVLRVFIHVEEVVDHQ